MSLGTPPPIAPIKRVSPSRFFGLKQCSLREVWRSGGAPAPLPKGPGAWLGQIIHSLLEQAGKHEIHDAADIDAAWQALLEGTETEMTASPLVRHFVPLERTAPHFEIRKRQAYKLASAMIQVRGAGGSGGKAASELWLQTADGLVGGKVDRVLTGRDGVTIIDFKTGAVTDPASADRPQVKPEYRAQLMLYAALYKTMKGAPPSELQIAGLDGQVHSVDFSMDECEELLQDALGTLMAVNEIITSSKPVGQKMAELATPTGSTCLYCEFRPDCGPYLAAMSTTAWIATEPRPIDALGTVSDIRTLGNGRQWIRLTTAAGETLSIRGLTPGRHPALSASPRQVAIFSLSSDSVPGTYTENQMTTSYAA